MFYHDLVSVVGPTLHPNIQKLCSFSSVRNFYFFTFETKSRTRVGTSMDMNMNKQKKKQRLVKNAIVDTNDVEIEPGTDFINWQSIAKHKLQVTH